VTIEEECASSQGHAGDFAIDRTATKAGKQGNMELMEKSMPNADTK
jgi:hypothetical protein